MGRGYDCRKDLITASLAFDTAIFNYDDSVCNRKYPFLVRDDDLCPVWILFEFLKSLNKSFKRPKIYSSLRKKHLLRCRDSPYADVEIELTAKPFALSCAVHPRR